MASDERSNGTSPAPGHRIHDAGRTEPERVTERTGQRAGEMAAGINEKEGRDEHDARQAMRELVAIRRANFRIRAGQALNRLGEFVTAAGNALGEISRDEACEALKREAARVFEDLRWDPPVGG